MGGRRYNSRCLDRPDSANPPTAKQRLDGLSLRGLELEFFQAAADEKLLYSRCEECNLSMFPLRSVCSRCGSTQVRLAESAGRGNVLSVSIVMRSPSATFKGSEPYNVAIVALDEGFQILSNLEDVCNIGDRVEVFFLVDGGFGLPLFRKAP